MPSGTLTGLPGRLVKTAPGLAWIAPVLLAACGAGDSPAGPENPSSAGRPQADMGSPNAGGRTPREAAAEIRNQCGIEADSVACSEQRLAQLVDTAGIAMAMATLETLIATDRRVADSAHALAHGLGIAAYRSPETVSATFRACPPIVASGCYHGVIQGYFLDLQRHGGEFSAADLDRVCAPHVGTPFLYFQCAHALGHGLMAINDNHIPLSLQDCDRASDAYVRESCYGGVFMENIVHVTRPHNTAAGHAMTQHRGHEAEGSETSGSEARSERVRSATPFPQIKPLDPLYPCNAVAEKYQGPCYGMQTSAILFYNNGSVSATAAACAQAPEPMRPICFTSLGRDVLAIASRDHSRSIVLCAEGRTSAVPQGETWCLIGVMENLVNLTADPGAGMSFCRDVSVPDHKQACYRAVGGTIAVLESSSAARAARCAVAEPEYVAACRAGAQIG